MKLINPKRIKLMASWKMDYMRIDSTYSGVLEGGISEKTNDFIIKSSRYYFKKLEGRGEEEVNIFPRYMEKIKQVEPVLKPLQLHTLLNDMDNLVFLVTFLDENEEVEDVINEILSMPELIKKEFMF